MPRTRRALLASAFSVTVGSTLLAACAAQPELRHQQEAGTDLSRYERFAFFDATQARPQGYTDLATARLREAVRAELERRGYRYDEARPELRVNLMAALIERQDLRAVPAARGPWPYRTGAVETVEVREGTLVIDLVDAARMALVWRGVAEGRVDDRALANPGGLLGDAVREVLAALPARHAS